MLSCDISMAIKMVKNIKYEEAILMAGISNTLYTTSYNSRNIYIAKGRGIILIDELLDKIHVNYKELTLDEVYELSPEEYNHLLIITPLQAVDNFEKINTNVVQFFNTYATFQLIDIKEKDLVLELASDLEKIYKTVSYDHLKKIASLKVKPLGINIKFMLIEKDCTFKKDIINTQIKKMIDEFITPQEVIKENGGWWKGPLFYDKLKECIADWKNEQIKVIKFILYQSILDGSSFFYRKEFLSALDLLNIDDDRIKTNIDNAAKEWRSLGRHLKNHLAAEKELDINYTNSIIDSIKENEISSFNLLNNEIMKREK